MREHGEEFALPTIGGAEGILGFLAFRHVEVDAVPDGAAIGERTRRRAEMHPSPLAGFAMTDPYRLIERAQFAQRLLFRRNETRDVIGMDEP